MCIICYIYLHISMYNVCNLLPGKHFLPCISVFAISANIFISCQKENSLTLIFSAQLSTQTSRQIKQNWSNKSHAKGRKVCNYSLLRRRQATFVSKELTWPCTFGIAQADFVSRS